MSEDAALLDAPAIRDKLSQMEEALGRKQWLRYREHRRVMGDILHDLQEKGRISAAATSASKKSRDVGTRRNRTTTYYSSYLFQLLSQASTRIHSKAFIFSLFLSKVP